MNLQYALVLFVVLAIFVVIVSVVMPEAQAQIAQALAPLQDIAASAPVQ